MGRKRGWSSVELGALGGRKVSFLWHCYCCCSSFRYSSSSSLLLAVHPGDRCHKSSEHAAVLPRLSCLKTTSFCPTHRISSWLGVEMAAESWRWRWCAALDRIGVDAPRPPATRNRSLSWAHSRFGRSVPRICGDADGPAGNRRPRPVDWPQLNQCCYPLLGSPESPPESSARFR